MALSCWGGAVHSIRTRHLLLAAIPSSAATQLSCLAQVAICLPILSNLTTRSLVFAPWPSRTKVSPLGATTTLLAPLKKCPLFPRASLSRAGRCIAFRLEVGTVTTRLGQVPAKIFARGGRPIAAKGAYLIQSIASGCQALRLSRRRFGPCARSHQCRPAPAYIIRTSSRLGEIPIKGFRVHRDLWIIDRVDRHHWNGKRRLRFGIGLQRRNARSIGFEPDDSAIQSFVVVGPAIDRMHVGERTFPVRDVRDVAKVEGAVLHVADENAFAETAHGQNIGEILLLQLRARGGCSCDA